MKVGIIVPSCRELELERFLQSWDAEFAEKKLRVYVVEDSEHKSFQLNPSLCADITHLAWEDASPELLGCINVRSPGCRQIGFWKAYADGCDLMLTLDDDVRPVSESHFVAEFCEVLAKGIPVWVDPLLNYRSRGYPKFNTGRLPVHVHVGGFLGIPDVDAETQTAHESEFENCPPQYDNCSKVVAPGQFIPVNGGIVGWRRELTPFIHYTLWDQELQYRRFDDIWMGVILKLVLDLANLRMSYGPPWVRHDRASDPIKNLEYEKEGKKWNEEFWEILRDKVFQRASQEHYSLDAAYLLVAHALGELDSSWASKESRAMIEWHKLFY